MHFYFLLLFLAASPIMAGGRFSCTKDAVPRDPRAIVPYLLPGLVTIFGAIDRALILDRRDLGSINVIDEHRRRRGRPTLFYALVYRIVEFLQATHVAQMGRGIFTVTPDGSVLVLDAGPRRLIQMRRDGEIQTVASDRYIRGTQDYLGNTNSIATTPSGAIVLAPTMGGIRIIQTDGTHIHRGYLWNCSSQHVAVSPRGQIFASDRTRNHVDIHQEDGTYVATFGNTGNQPGQFQTPSEIAVGSDGTVVVVDSGNHRIQVFREDGTFVRAIGSRGNGNSQFNDPHGITFTPNGLILVSDYGNHRLQLLNLNGSFMGAFPFHTPATIRVMPNGLVVVLNVSNSRIEVINWPLVYLSGHSF